MARNADKANWQTARMGGADRHTLYYGRTQLGVVAPVGDAFFAQPFVEHRSKSLPTAEEAKAYLMECFFPAAESAPAASVASVPPPSASV